MAERKYPIGVQDFKKLIEENWLYIDKTDIIYKLAHNHNTSFLSRPRRFGKSLLCSTLRYYFEGEKDLFKGLKIEKLENDWIKYPVFHFGLSTGTYTSEQSLINTLSAAMLPYEQKYGSDSGELELSSRFAGLLRRAHEQTGRKAVVIIDEYDKPLLEAISDKELQDKYRIILKSFYGTMKFSDEHLQFIFLTGVTKFSKVSVFSDLNNLRDISMSDDYAALCGISEEELKDTFCSEITEMSERRGQTEEETFASVKEMYDGYHFSPKMIDVYNPFSLLNAIADKNLGSYWFATGTPTYLTWLLKNAGYDLKDLTGVKMQTSKLGDISEPEKNPVPMLFQSGYLTLKGYDSRFDKFELDFPNREVKSGFFDFLLPTYVPDSVRTSEFDVSNFVEDVESGRIDEFMTRLKSLISNIPYTQAPEDKLQKLIEQQYQNVVYIVFTLMGFYTKVEYHTSLGRIDLSVETPDYIYIMELKVGQGTADDALKQIEEKHYADPFMSSGKEIVKIGVGFDNATRNIDEWKVVK